MSLELFGHPFSSYTWKALIALYEAGTPFEFRDISGDKYPDNEAEFLAHWPVGKFPLLVDDGEPIMESSVIVEHVAPALVPTDRAAAREVRMFDRIFDNHVMSPTQAVVAEHLPFTSRPRRTKPGSRGRSRRSTKFIPGSTRGSRAADGLRAMRSPWRIARVRRRSFMPTGSTRSRIVSQR